MQGVTLVSFKREPLEHYLAASGSVLVRMFDFRLLRFDDFTEWPEGPEQLFHAFITGHGRNVRRSSTF